MLIYIIKQNKGGNKMIGTFKEHRKNSFGIWQEETITIASFYGKLRNVSGKVTDANWCVDYETPSTFGKTGTIINSKYFWYKKDAQEWINSFNQ